MKYLLWIAVCSCLKSFPIFVAIFKAFVQNDTSGSTPYGTSIIRKQTNTWRQTAVLHFSPALGLVRRNDSKDLILAKSWDRNIFAMADVLVLFIHGINFLNIHSPINHPSVSYDSFKNIESTLVFLCMISRSRKKAVPFQVAFYNYSILERLSSSSLTE